MIRGWKGYLVYAAGFLVVLEIMIGAAIYWWPTFVDNIQNVKKLAAPIPMLKDLANLVDDKGIPAYVAGQHYFKGCAALGTAAAVLFAAPAVAGEAHRGTMEIWLARPVSRVRLFTERWIGGLVAIVLPVFLSSATIPWMLSYVDATMTQADLARCSAHMVLFLAPIYAAAFAWSAHGSEPLRIAFVMLFLAILSFALYLVEFATDYTPYRLVDVRVFLDIIETGRFDWRMEGPLLLMTAIGYVVGLKGFLRRTP